MVNTYSIELHIDKLVLHGFSSENAYQISEAVQQELTRLLQEQGFPPGLSRDADYVRLNAGSFNLQPGAKGEAVGNDIANSVYTSFTK